MEDVRTRRGAHIASDHHLLVAKMKLKLKKHYTNWVDNITKVYYGLILTDSTNPR